MALNHSCLPNVAPSFDPRTRTLAFHAITEIPRGHAVECAYVDLLQTRKRRQSLLAAGFGFDCICGRSLVMEQLMRVVNTKDRGAKQRVARLKKEHENVFNRSDEAQFALYTAEMQLARTQGDWVHVVEAAERLLKIWARSELPANYHTTETLHLQLCLAAKQAGMMTEKARASAQQVATIRRICGYPHPETPIG
ncbi:hypothetical protein PHYSODRAFT_497025 [Phytophthora sojae]|uniref:SET domain-containing protein n=1 Tax=Phytophthora sojae (strain P6497) TaxID=1094619 RepID=G4ZAL1_PHYSP|nr:hypothetical protein PHYSODRAFT_497025 [Phytophthora sojae]EGZ19208.1 hypothetical protein PHYSODRAFT_497025 [Phytophthora sojae]|eukprot:XP_009521925.1 hypothetical protein PHYSODRAFT_497025 [Phytophthora sojae]